MKRTCIQCGKEFEITQSEIAFFKKKKLSLPKRCKECRELNKEKKGTDKKQENDNGQETAGKVYESGEKTQDNGKKNQGTSQTVAGKNKRTADKNQNNINQDNRNQNNRNQKNIERNQNAAEQKQEMAGKTTQSVQMQSAAEEKSTEKKAGSGKKRLAYLALALLLGFGGGGTAISALNGSEAEEVKIEQTVEMEDTQDEDIQGEEANTEDVQETADQNTEEAVEAVKEEDADTEQDTEVQSEELTEVVIEYEFRNDDLFESHYKKHGIEMGFETKEEYLAGANKVIASPDVLHKIEAEDGDDVYYLEETNEFVVVSKDGYLRTYFNPSDGIDYYNRQ